MPNKLNKVMTRTIRTRGDKGKRECSVLFDTGASDSFVSREVAEALGIIAPLKDGPKSYTLADGNHIQTQDGVELILNINGRFVEDDFVVNPSAGPHIDDIILGMSTMEKYGMSLDLKHHDVVFSLKSAPVPSAPQQEGVSNMDEKFKRILARLGVTEISDSLTDEDAISMICEKSNRGYQAVAAPLVALTEATSGTTAAKTPDVTVAPTPSSSGFFAKLFTKLGITSGADVTEAQAIDLVSAQVKKPAPATAVASRAILSVLSLPETSTDEDVVGAILATQHPGNVVTVEQHHDLEKTHREYRLNSLVMSAMQGGKLTPAEKVWAQDKVKEWDAIGLDGLSTLEKFLDKRPKLMPIGERLPVKTAHDTDFDDATMAIAKQMGVSPEIMKKHAQ